MLGDLVTARPVAQVARNHRIARPLLLALALSVALVVGGSMPAFARVVEAPASAVLRPTLPRPTGDDHIGVVPLHLVDRSYVVATIDHTHDASEVEFPDGRVEVSAVPPITPEVVAKAVAVRVADTRFVLDSLVALNAGRNPDAERRPLPAGLRGALNLLRVGMFGHSLGGATAAQAMYEDRRIKAGVNLDGTMAGAVVNAGLDRPFMLVAAQNHGRDTDASWARFWVNLRGWRLNLRLTGAGHNSFTDVQVLIPQLARVLQLPPEVVQQLIGTVDPHRSVLIQRAYLTAFFDLHLLHRDGRLLRRPSPRFPELRFVP